MTGVHGSMEMGRSDSADSDRWSEDHMLNHQEVTELDFVIFSIMGKKSFTFNTLKYLTFTLIGISLLWPWNSFLTASAYYADIFAGSPNLIKIYSSTMMSISTITSTIFNYYLSQSQTGVDYNHRVNLGLSMTIAVFIIMGTSCISDVFLELKDKVIFIGLMIMVFLSALATCLAQNGTMAIANVMGAIYTNAVMVGQAIAGVLPSIALIISILIIDKPEKKISQASETDVQSRSTDFDNHVKNYGVFVYYITTSLISFTSMTLLYWTNYYKAETAYNILASTMENGVNGIEVDVAVGSDEVTQQKHVPFMQLWGKLKQIVSAIFLTFSITLIFPVFASSVESVNSGSTKSFFNKSIYIPFIYLVWNLGDLMGRVFCGFFPKFVIKSPRTQIIYAVLRILFIPLFMTCNIHPYTAKGESSALINSDVWYIMLQFIFGLSNGQLCTSCFMIIRDYCDDDDEKEAAGGFSTVFLSIGLAFGSILSYGLVAIIN